MGRPYAYLRKSVVRADDPGNSAEAQEAAVRALADFEGDADRLTILSDWDRSGRLGRERRPGYDALWQAIESGECSAIYSYSLSRLSRRMSELTKLFEVCQERNIPIRLRADKIDTGSASGRMTANIIASVAEFEADVAGERRKAANAAKVARGESLRTVHFYGEHEGDDPDAVLKAFREAGSFYGAAGLLNERKVPTRTSKYGWRPSSVAVVVRRIDPGLVAPRPAKRVPAGGGSVGFILARLLRCPYCETLLTGGRDRRRGTVHYICHMSGTKPHGRTSVSEHRILARVKEEAERLRLPRPVLAVEGDEAKRHDLEQRRVAALDMREARQINRDELTERLTAIADEMAKLDERTIVLKVPTELDWTWPPREVNAVLRALWRDIKLDPATFDPIYFDWVVPEMRDGAATGPVRLRDLSSGQRDAVLAKARAGRNAATRQ